MNRVFITHDVGKINFIDAEQYGTLIPVINGHVNHTQLKRIMGIMQDKMRDITKEDWIVPAGNFSLIALAGYIMGERTGHIRLLSWDNQAKRYVPNEVRVR